jgi:hypothetical protein
LLSRCLGQGAQGPPLPWHRNTTPGFNLAAPLRPAPINPGMVSDLCCGQGGSAGPLPALWAGLQPTCTSSSGGDSRPYGGRGGASAGVDSAPHCHWPCVSGSGRGLAPGCPVIGRFANRGVSHSSSPHSAELQAPGRLSLRGAASLALGSASGGRLPVAALTARGGSRH